MKLLLIGFLTCTICFGQNQKSGTAIDSISNLIPNAGFEYSIRCPNRGGQISRSVGWSDPTNGSSDYFSTCGEKGYSVPKNWCCVKSPFQGNAYAALLGRKDTREYIQVRLSSPLEKGQKYFCSIAISASNKHCWVSSDIGLLFTAKKISREHSYRISDHEPQIQSHPDSIFTDYEWHIIQGYFIAKGGEEYLTIGSFRETVSKLQLSEPKYGNAPSWYNFIDNITTKLIVRKKPLKVIQTELSQVKNITFENRSDELDSTNFGALSKVLKILKRNKEVSIKVIGHTDNNGSKASNRTLSISRCRAVKKYLVTNGIAKKRILIEGKGDSQPLLPNTTDENRIINRRVELRVL